jgi:uncharacterized protein
MDLTAQIKDQLTTAMKSGAADRVAVLRLLNSSIKNEQIKLGHELSQSEVLKVVQREAKQRKDSIEAYKAGNRQDLADAEEAELVIIQEFLPQQMSEEELSKVVDAVIANNHGAQMGVIIGQVMQQSNGQADGATVARMVRQKLQ